MNELQNLIERLIKLYPDRYVSIGIDCGSHRNGVIEFDYTLYVKEVFSNIEFKNLSSMEAFIGHLEWDKNNRAPNSVDQLLNLN